MCACMSDYKAMIECSIIHMGEIKNKFDKSLLYFYDD